MAQQPFESRKNFLLDTFKLGSGTALAQLVTVLSVPVLSRLFLPESFGAATLFGAIVIIFSTISGLRYELAILLPEEASDGFLLFSLQSVFTLFFGLIVGFASWALRNPIALWLNEPSLASYLWLIGPAIFIFGMMNGLNYWNTRQKQFKLIAVTKLLNSLATVVFQLIFGFWGYATSGVLIAGNVFGKVVEDAIQGWKTLVDVKNNAFRFDFAKILRLLKRYQKFPIFYTGSTLINTLSWYVPAFILAMFFSTKIVGFYAVGERVIRMPMNTIGKAISQVFFQRSAEAYRENTLGTLFRDTVQMLSRLGLFPMIILAVVGREIFIVCLGENWSEAGVYTQILSLYAFIWFVSSPISTLVSVIEKQEISLYLNIVNLTSRVLSLAVGGVLHQARLGLLLYSISGIVLYGWLLLWLGKIVGVPPKRTVLDMLQADLFISLFAVALLLALKYTGSQPLILVGVSVVLLLCHYAFSFKKYKHLLSRCRPVTG